MYRISHQQSKQEEFIYVTYGSEVAANQELVTHKIERLLLIRETAAAKGDRSFSSRKELQISKP